MYDFSRVFHKAFPSQRFKLIFVLSFTDKQIKVFFFYEISNLLFIN